MVKSSRVLALLLLLALVVTATAPVCVAGPKPKQFEGGSEGNLWIETRGNKLGVLLVRKNGALLASIAVNKAKWQKLVDTWHNAEAVHDTGVWRVVGILKMGDIRLEVEAGASVKLTFIDDRLSHTFTIDREDYEAFGQALENVLNHLE